MRICARAFRAGAGEGESLMTENHHEGGCTCEHGHEHPHDGHCEHGHAHSHEEKSIPAIDFDVEQMGLGWEGVCPCGCGGVGHHIGGSEGEHDHADGASESLDWHQWADAEPETYEEFQQGYAFDREGNLLEDPAEDYPEPPFEQFDYALADCTYHVRRWGDAAQIPLVLLHGFMQTGATWEGLTARLARAHCLYAIDLLGHGETDTPKDPRVYAIPAQSDALAQLIAELVLPQHAAAAQQAGMTPARRAHVLGYSMGGRIALDLALRHPDVVYSLILESAGIGPADEGERSALAERAESWASLLRQDGMQAFVDRWEELPLFETQRRLPDEVKAAVRAERLANDPEAMALVALYAGQHTMALADENMAALGFSWMPVLYLAGTRDAKYLEVAERFVREGLDAKPVMGGHDLHLEAPGLFCDALEPHLRGNELRGV